MNNKASIDYLKLMGAQVMSVAINGKPMNCVVIPCAWNGITVTADEKTGQPRSAFQNLREWETSQKYRAACLDNHKDEEGYQAPSHQISVSYSEELENAYKKRIEERLRADATFMATNPTDEDIKSKVSIEVRNQTRIGYVTPLKRAEPAPYAGSAPTAQNVSNWSPASMEADVNDDLPF